MKQAYLYIYRTLASRLTKQEGGSVQVSVGNVREILKNLIMEEADYRVLNDTDKGGPLSMLALRAEEEIAKRLERRAKHLGREK